MKWLACLLLFFTQIAVLAQQFPAFRPLRYDEDYSAIKDDTLRNLYQKFKYAPLTKAGYISIGGEARLQYFHIRNEGWSNDSESTDGHVLNRNLLHADFHTSKSFRVFTQLQSSLAFSRAHPGPVEKNELELHQAFVDINTNVSERIQLTIRAGRQELSYGSQRLISVREGPNNRQSFDGLKILLFNKAIRSDIFYSHYVAAKNGAFNDTPSDNIKLWGIYVIKDSIPGINVDLYYLGFRNRNAIFDDATGKELRHSIGTRFWNVIDDWKYDFETLYQFGTTGNKKTTAWTASLNTSYTFGKTRLEPTFGLKLEIISGDRRYNDGKVQTFNAMFPRGAYFGLASLVGPANLVDIHPYISITISPKLDILIDYDAFWRHSKEDGLYGANGDLIFSGRNTMNKHIGNQYSFNIEYVVNAFFLFSTEFTWFDAGDYIKHASAGKNIVFGGITAALKF